MQLTIHRGAKEIGGTCVELKQDATRILLDFGMPLVSAQKEPFNPKILAGKSISDLKRLKILPDIKGLYKDGEKGIDAVLISHSHPDHYGLLNYIREDIPIYMSRGAKELIEVSGIFTPNKIGSLNAKIIDTRRPFRIGDFRITPYVVDHSAFDALAFLIEAGGKRLFYSGDFRGHGRKSALFRKMLKDPPADIDCLLMEGTSIGREDKSYKDELAVQRRIECILKETGNITFLFASSQNIDRIVSAYKACRATGSIFVIDLYTAYILERLRAVSKNIPQFDWKNMRVKFYYNQGKTLADKESVKILYRYKRSKIDFREINNAGHKILILARDNSLFPRILKKLKNPRDAKIIYSLWEGYLTDKFTDFCAKNGLIIEKVHTSGHATVKDLKAFANALRPKMLIPIHTLGAATYDKLFKNVTILKDGESLEL